MVYETVFDGSHFNWIGWQFIALPALFCCIGAFSVFSSAARDLIARGNHPEVARILPKLFLGFSAFLLVVSSFFMVWGKLEVARAADNPDCQIAEGIVENFVAMPRSGHAMESYTVDGVEFSYSDYIISDGYNNTVAHGGPVTAGSQVRICYFYRGRTQANIIAKLELAKEAADSPTMTQ